MSGSFSDRRQAAALEWLDGLEVALRNLLATRARAAEMSRIWAGSESLDSLAAQLVGWLDDCAGDGMLEAIAALRTGIEAEPGARPQDLP